MAHMGVDSRQYNAIRMELQGKIDSVVALRTGYGQDQTQVIASLKKLIKKLSIDTNKSLKSVKSKKAASIAIREY